ncbi:MAG TPA: PA14 domain-containing protein, partial [bacterium]
PRDGIYRFYLTSDDGSALYIGREQVVNNDGIHGEWEESGEIALKAGYHPLRVVMFQKLGGLTLSAAIEGPGMEKQAIGEQMLFHAGGGK